MDGLTALGITKEELLDAAAQKLCDQFHDSGDLYNRFEQEIHDRVHKVTGTQLEDIVTTKITEATEKILDETVQPRNIWGDKEGEPTTIRAALSEKARDFWMEKVDKDGKRTGSYGNKPRFEYLVQDYLKKEFEAAMAENITAIVQGFREAMTKEAGVWLGEHIAKVFPKTGRR